MTETAVPERDREPRVAGRRPQASVAMLIPVYNAPAGALERTLASIDAQSHPVTVFVVDDGSSPPVAVDRAGSSRGALELLRLPRNGGIVEALNHGLARILSDGDFDYVARQDAGDVDVGERIAKQVALLDAEPDVALVGSWVQWNEPDGRPAFVFEAPTEPRRVAARMRSGPAFVHPSCMMRVSALRELGPYAARFAHCEDYELFFRFVRRYRCTNLPEVLVHTELDPNGISIPKRRRQLLGRLRVQLAHFAPLSPRAYAGVLRTVLLVMTPYSVLAAIKRRRRAIR